MNVIHNACKTSCSAIAGMLTNLFTPRSLYKLATCAIIVSSIIPNVALAVTSATFRFFNNPGLADTVETIRRKFVFIVVEHNIANLADAPLEVLTTSKNLPSRSVIFKGEDAAVLEKTRNIFHAIHASSVLRDVSTAKVDNMKAKSASFKLADGLSLTGPYRFIQKCLNSNVNSEDDLKHVALEFEGGFDAEVSTLHRIYKKMLPAYKNQALEIVYDEFARCMDLKFEDMNIESSKYNFFNDFFGVAHIPDVARFDALSEGLYYVTFPKGYQKSHAVVMAKYNFGTYIFDPEFGLMSTKDHTPTQGFLKVSAAYQDVDRRCQVHKIIKAN